MKATRAFAEREREGWVGQDVGLDVFLRTLPFKYMAESSKKEDLEEFFTSSKEESLSPINKKVEMGHKKIRFRKKLKSQQMRL